MTAIANFLAVASWGTVAGEFSFRAAPRRRNNVARLWVHIRSIGVSAWREKKKREMHVLCRTYLHLSTLCQVRMSREQRSTAADLVVGRYAIGACEETSNGAENRFAVLSFQENEFCSRPQKGLATAKPTMRDDRKWIGRIVTRSPALSPRRNFGALSRGHLFANG